MVDEALSIGALGRTGRGVAEHFGVTRDAVEVWMGGLSKSLASCGGYIAGRKELIHYLRCTAPGFIYTTGMSPANTAAALTALRVVVREPERVRRLQENSEYFRSRARAAGLDVGTSDSTQVVPIIIGDALPCIRAHQRLLAVGINVQPILEPAVPPGGARLRFFLSATHTPQQIDRTIAALASLLPVEDTLHV